MSDFSPWMYKGEPVTEMPKRAVGFLYLIITPENRYYIGQCANKQWKSYWGGGTGLKKYYRKHGKKETKRIIVMFFDDYVELDDAETHLTIIVDAKENPKYYNLRDGGKTNAKISEQTRKAMSESQKGKTLTPEHRAKISKSNMGKKMGPLSEERKEKLRIFNTGRKLSDEAKAKCSAARKGRVMPWTQESRDKVSRTMTGRKKNPESIAKAWATKKAKREERFWGGLVEDE